VVIWLASLHEGLEPPIIYNVEWSHTFRYPLDKFSAEAISTEELELMRGGHTKSQWMYAGGCM